MSSFDVSNEDVNDPIQGPLKLCESSVTDEDIALVDRIRPFINRRKGYSEKKMFGGVCFMINGNMCVGPWKGSLIVRLDKSEHEQTQSKRYVRPMDITGRVMKGWARVEPEGIETDEQLKAWVVRGIKFAQSLPAK